MSVVNKSARSCAQVYWSSYWSYCGGYSESISSLRNSGLLARLESINAIIEPKGDIARITLPNGKTFEFSGRYGLDSIGDIEDYLNSQHINKICSSSRRPDDSSGN